MRRELVWRLPGNARRNNLLILSGALRRSAQSKDEKGPREARDYSAETKTASRTSRVIAARPSAYLLLRQAANLGSRP
jgi:hypothetical protein